MAGNYVEKLIAALRRVNELTGGTMTVHPGIMTTGDEAIMMYNRVTGRRPDV